MKVHLPFVMGALLAMASPACQRVEASPRSLEKDLSLTRGSVRARLLLTGELDAVNADAVVVPTTSQWQLELKWIEVEGTAVKAGQRIAEFNNSAFLGELRDKRLSVLQASMDLDRQRAEGALANADKAFEVERAKVALEKARLVANLPRESLAPRQWHENQLELERLESAYRRALDNQATRQKATRLDEQMKQIALEGAQKKIRTAELAIGDLVLRAPRDGIMVVAQNATTGRKFQPGDMLTMGTTVATLPDLSSMYVRAYLSDVDEGRIAVGLPVTVTLDAYPDRPFRGVVRELSPVARTPSLSSQRPVFFVRVVLEEADHDDRWLPGLSAKVVIEPKGRDDALLAPRETLALQRPPALLYPRQGDPIPVEVGLCDNERCEVKPRSEDPPSRLVPGLALRSAKDAP